MSALDYVLEVPCAYCGASRGNSCWTASGARATYPHSARERPIYRAWIDGFTEGQRDILGAFESENHGYLNARRAEYRKGAQR